MSRLLCLSASPTMDWAWMVPLTHCTVPALVARRTRAAIIADVVLAYPVVEAGLGDTWRTTYGSRRASETVLWTP